MILQRNAVPADKLYMLGSYVCYNTEHGTLIFSENSIDKYSEMSSLSMNTVLVLEGIVAVYNTFIKRYHVSYSKGMLIRGEGIASRGYKEFNSVSVLKELHIAFIPKLYMSRVSDPFKYFEDHLHNGNLILTPVKAEFKRSTVGGSAGEYEENIYVGGFSVIASTIKSPHMRVPPIRRGEISPLCGMGDINVLLSYSDKNLNTSFKAGVQEKSAVAVVTETKESSKLTPRAAKAIQFVTGMSRAGSSRRNNVLSGLL